MTMTAYFQRRLVCFGLSSCLCAVNMTLTANALAQSAKSYGLFGSPQCTEWASMSTDARVNWTRAFISALSKGYQEIRRTDKQKFSNSEGVDIVVEAIDRHCATSPYGQASEAVGPFLR